MEYFCGISWMKIIKKRHMGQKRSCFRQPCLYRTKKELLIIRQGEIILYKPYLIQLSHPVMTPQFAL